MAKILTTHVGALPSPKNVMEHAHRRSLGEKFDKAAYEKVLRVGVDDVVKHQKEVGIDLVNDGEIPHNVGWAWDYGAWWSYVVPRLGGVEQVASGLWTSSLTTQIKTPMTPNDFQVGDWGDRRDMAKFQEAYQDPQSGCGIPEQWMTAHHPLVKGPIKFVGQEEVKRDIANLKAALKAAGISEKGAFINSIGPPSVSRMANQYYKNEEDLMVACAEAMREEYKTITDAGLTVQIDDPAFAENWDQQKKEPSVAGYRKYTEKCVEIINHSIRGLPPEQIRFHLCWGSWHGPHTTDIPFKHLVDLMLKINAGLYTFEAANARHEHEWKIWKEVKLADGKFILPGVVTHSTNLIEHPELVADRIMNFASAVGPDKVIASTDCGLGGRVHPLIAWAKLKSLSEGAEIASKQLYRKAA